MYRIVYIVQGRALFWLIVWVLCPTYKVKARMLLFIPPAAGDDGKLMDIMTGGCKPTDEYNEIKRNYHVKAILVRM